jgi:MFS-type transporter involved in bile tolerance (Atg22 family)
MFGILALLALIGCAILWIIVLIKIFQNDGALKGIIGLLCWLFAFIWGWMHANRLGVKQIMMAWTVLLILYFIFAMLSGGFNYSYNLGTPTP